MLQRTAEGDVVANLAGIAEEVVVVELRSVADDAAAEGNAVLDVAIAIDERLDEGVIGRLAGNQDRNA